MHVLRTLDQLASIRRPVVAAAGVFDGVHRGHQQVIRLCHERATALGAEPWLMTFDPHPLRIVQPSAAPALLTTLPLKLDLAAGLGLAGAMVIPFTHDFAALEPAAFLDHLLERLPLLRGLVIGENWRFGRQAKGNVTLLRELAAHRNLDVAAATQIGRASCRERG